MFPVVVHNSPHLAITDSLSRSAYKNLKLFKILSTPRRLKWAVLSGTYLVAHP